MDVTIRVFLAEIRMCGSTSRYNATPGVGLGGLVPTTPKAIIGGLPSTDSGFLYFRLCGQQMGLQVTTLLPVSLFAPTHFV